MSLNFFDIQMYYVDRKKVEASLLTLIVKALLCPMLNNIQFSHKWKIEKNMFMLCHMAKIDQVIQC
jgi:hypothetical protein